MPVPTVRATIIAPAPLLKERSFLRLHNRASKEALRDEGQKHWKERIPGHFRRSAAAKYGYMRRTEKYMRYKARRFRSVTDLVKTGRSRDQMTREQPKIRIGGKAADDSGDAKTLKLTIELKFHFGQDAQKAVAKAIRSGKRFSGSSSGALRTGVTIAQMRKEVAAITDEEAQAIARGFSKGYGQRLAVALARAPRIRKRVNQARGPRS